MGKRWESFQGKVLDFLEGPGPTPPTAEKPGLKAVQNPMRPWRNEMLTKPQMQDLEETANTPGYEVLQDLWASTLEGFITFLVELDPSDSDKILAYHKVVHGLHLGIKSVNAQVNGYAQLLQAEREEAEALKAVLDVQYGSDPLKNTEVLNRLLNPIHQPTPPEPRQRVQKGKVETPLDTMLRDREKAEIRDFQK